MSISWPRRPSKCSRRRWSTSQCPATAIPSSARCRPNTLFSSRISLRYQTVCCCDWRQYPGVGYEMQRIKLLRISPSGGVCMCGTTKSQTSSLLRYFFFAATFTDIFSFALTHTPNDLFYFLTLYLFTVVQRRLYTVMMFFGEIPAQNRDDEETFEEKCFYSAKIKYA